MSFPSLSVSSAPEFLIVAVVVLFVIYRQIAPRSLRSADRLWLLPVLVTIYGAYSLIQRPPTIAGAIGFLGVQLAVAVVAGVIRGLTIRYYLGPDGRPMQKGTWLTVVIWVVYLGLKIGIDLLSGSAFSSITITIGVSLLVQAGIAYWRGQAFLQRNGVQATAGGNYR